jgi:hypothetical protein
MSHTRTLFWILLLMAGTGLMDGPGREDGADLHLPAGLAFSYLCFLWYRADSDARGFLRSRWLSMGVVVFTPGALPYYLLRSRKDGERGQALMGYAGCLALVALAAWVGVAARIALG